MTTTIPPPASPIDLGDDSGLEEIKAPTHVHVPDITMHELNLQLSSLFDEIIEQFSPDWD